MAYSTTLPNMDEARLSAIVAALQAHIADLSASCSRDSLLPVSSFVSGSVINGDPQYMPAMADSGPAWIAVVAGGRDAGIDMRARPIYVDNANPQAFSVAFTTGVFCYVHPEAFAATVDTWSSVTLQATRRQTLLARMADYVRADVFNNATGIKLTLASQEFAVAPAFDMLVTHVQNGVKGYFEKSFGERGTLHGVHLEVVSMMQC